MNKYCKAFIDDVENLEFLANVLGEDSASIYMLSFGINNKSILKFLRCYPYVITIPLYFFTYIYTIILFFYNVCNASVKGKRKADLNYHDVCLFFTSPFYSRYVASGLNYKSALWILSPDIDSSKYDLQDKKIMHIGDSIYLSHCLPIFINQIKVITQSFYYLHNKVVPIYKIIKYVENAIILEEMTKDRNIYFSNQSDRWALLFDLLPAKSRTLLQHGIDYEDKHLPRKLKNINVFYSITNNTWQNSYKTLLACEPVLKIMNPTIHLTCLSVEKSILIISHPIYFNIERTVLDNLTNFNGKVFLKVHPTCINSAKYQALKNRYGISIITDSTFPKADFVVSYFSTLAYEFINFDIPVYMYDSEQSFNIEELNNKIRGVFGK